MSKVNIGLQKFVYGLKLKYFPRVCARVSYMHVCVCVSANFIDLKTMIQSKYVKVSLRFLFPTLISVCVTLQRASDCSDTIERSFFEKYWWAGPLPLNSSATG